MEVTKLKSGVFADVDWSKQNYQAAVTISVKLSPDSNKPDTAVAMIGDKKLGELKPESFQKLSAVLKAHNVPIQGYMMHATITSSAPSAARVVIDPNTVKYPQLWNPSQEQESTTKAAPVIQNKFPTLAWSVPRLTDANETPKQELLIAQQVQAIRTLEVVPIIHAFLKSQVKTTVKGKFNTVSWNSETNELTLWRNGASNPKMRVKFSNGQYHPLPISNNLEEVQANGLSEADVQHFQQIAPLISAKLGEIEGTLLENENAAIQF